MPLYIQILLLKTWLSHAIGIFRQTPRRQREWLEL